MPAWPDEPVAGATTADPSIEGKTVAMTVPDVSRERALAHRLRVQALDRPPVELGDLAVWDLGLQDSPAGSAAQALAARLPGGIDDVGDLADARRYTTVWATRGAPLIVRSGDVKPLAAALWPIDEADAVSRLAGNGQQLRKAGLDPIDAIRVTAETMRNVVTQAMTKGEASTKVSARIPDEYVTWCRGCQAHHLGDQLMRLAGLPAGLRLVPGASPATLEPIGGWPGVPDEQVGAEGLVRTYLHLYGPAVPADVGAFIQSSAKAVKSVWPDHLAEARVDGRKAWLPEEDLDDLLEAEPTTGLVRLLPRSDPWLLARDRKATVPDAARRKVLWPAIGWPGAVLVDGEVAGAWRTKATKSSLNLVVEPFTKLSTKVRRAVEAESAHIARSRDAADVAVSFDSHG